MSSLYIFKPLEMIWRWIFIPWLNFEFELSTSPSALFTFIFKSDDLPAISADGVVSDEEQSPNLPLSSYKIFDISDNATSERVANLSNDQFRPEKIGETCF